MRTPENILTDSIVNQINKELKLGFIISVLEVTEDLLVVKVFQKEIKNGMVLTQKQLVAKGKEVFKNIKGTIRIRPLTFTLDIREITPYWIKNRMKILGIKRNDVIPYLHIDKSTLSLPKWLKKEI